MTKAATAQSRHPETTETSVLGHGRENAAAGSRTRNLIDPSTGKSLGTTALVPASEVEMIVRSARGALGAWSARSGRDRAQVIEAIADAWEARADDMSLAVTREMGMPLGFSRFNNAVGPIAVLRYYAGLARRMEPEDSRTPFAFSGRVIVRRNPVGVVAAIVPWNYPWMLLATKLGPALAAGCTVIVKPAEENAISGGILGEILQAAGVPEGVVEVAVGGSDFAETLVRHPGVDKVAFTGSTAVGRRIAGIVGQRLGSVSLELGGKSAAIVLDDADMERTLAELPQLSFLNSGQTCFAQTRVIATPSVYERVVQGYVDYVDAQILGSPVDVHTTLGPVVSERQRENILNYIQLARAAGARVHRAAIEIPTEGFFVPPTILADVDNGWDVAQEEIFGPVVCIIPARDEEHAVRIANDSDYGLAGSVWTRNVEKGIALSRQIAAGSFGINGYLPDLSSPWGGVKASGSGRENGPEAVDGFLRFDAVYEFASPEPNVRQ